MPKKSARKKSGVRRQATAHKKTRVRKKATGARKKVVARKKAATRKEPTAKKTAGKKTPTAPAVPSTGGTAQGGSGTLASGAASTSGVAGIRIRMYRVGFGDFFLMSLPGADGKLLHILVDCGVHAMNLNSIGDAIADMKNVTGGNLALVVMTHRHADHISGFAIGKSDFAGFTVEQVWMSWFEDPTNAAAAGFQQTLTALASNLQLTLAARGSDATDEMKMAANATGDLGAAGGGASNQTALDVLHGGFKNEAPVSYYQAGDTPTLPASLQNAGLSATILGPPIDETLVQQMDGKGHQYLASNSDTGAPPRRFNPAYISSSGAYPSEAFEIFSATEIAKTVAASQPDLMAAQAQQVNNTLNNQSLVILFSFRGKTLLFVGDAQWGNWQNFLFGGAFGTAGHNALTDAAKKTLGNIDFYKVGHHGSTNATPIDAVQAMRKGCVAMCSTQPGAYGKIANNSEVPRTPLITALEQTTEQQLARSDMVSVPGAQSPPVLQAIQGLPAPGPLPSIFQPGPGDALFIDYEM